MSAPIEVAVRDLLVTARALYGGDPPAQLEDLERRLAEPLRLAIAGIVKAGKSTLLNAIIGERVAATDAGECTRLVTWYRHATTRSVTAVARDGTTTRLPIRRSTNGQLAFE
ncbi:MAG: dynamin family protein, partial [Dermatophilaceae bacterium]